MDKVQCLIKSENKRMVTYLDFKPELKIGCFVTLKDHAEPQRRWEVLSISKPVKQNEIKGGKRAKNWYKNDFIRDDKGGFRNCE